MHLDNNTKDRIREVFNSAAISIENGEWSQGVAKRDNGRCMLAALYEACGGKFHDRVVYYIDSHGDGGDISSDDYDIYRIASYILHNNTPERKFAVWNDDKDTTKEMVVAKLREVRNLV